MTRGSAGSSCADRRELVAFGRLPGCRVLCLGRYLHSHRECFRPPLSLGVADAASCRGGDTNINEAVDGNVKLPAEWEDAVPRTPSRYRALSHSSPRMHGWSSSQMIQAGSLVRVHEKSALGLPLIVIRRSYAYREPRSQTLRTSCFECSCLASTRDSATALFQAKFIYGPASRLHFRCGAEPPRTCAGSVLWGPIFLV